MWGLTLRSKHRPISRKVNFTVVDRLGGEGKPANPAHNVHTYPDPMKS